VTTTPAPWSVVVANDGDIYVCSAEMLADGLNPICAIDSGPEHEDDDAALIAAAPELLEALDGLLRALRNENMSDDAMAQAIELWARSDNPLPVMAEAEPVVRALAMADALLGRVNG